MIFLNFSHPLSPDQMASIEEQCGRSIGRVIEIPTQFDHGEPFGPQASALVDAAGLTSVEWQT